jgi:hypothetical protein
MAAAPIEIVQGQSDDFAGPQPKSSEQQQNDIIPSADRRFPVTALQNAFYSRAGGEIAGRWRNTTRKIFGHHSSMSQVAEE